MANCHDSHDAKTLLGGGNSNICLSSPRKFAEDEPILTVAYFSKGLVKNHQPVFQALDDEAEMRVPLRKFLAFMRRSVSFAFRDDGPDVGWAPTELVGWLVGCLLACLLGWLVGWLVGVCFF